MNGDGKRRRQWEPSRAMSRRGQGEPFGLSLDDYLQADARAVAADVTRAGGTNPGRIESAAGDAGLRPSIELPHFPTLTRFGWSGGPQPPSIEDQIEIAAERCIRGRYVEVAGLEEARLAVRSGAVNGLVGVLANGRVFVPTCGPGIVHWPSAGGHSRIPSLPRLEQPQAPSHIINPEYPITPVYKYDYPWNAVGRLVMSKLGVSSFFGTGVLVGPRHVATSGHNLLDRDGVFELRMPPDWLAPQFGITKDADSPDLFSDRAVISAWFHPGWIGDEPDIDNDLAMAVLEDGELLTGWWGTFVADDQFLLGHKMFMLAHSGPTIEAVVPDELSLSGLCDVDSVSASRIRYPCSTIESFSGAPISFSAANHGNTLHGVHSTKCPQNLHPGLNCAYRLTSGSQYWIKLIICENESLFAEYPGCN